MTRGISRRIAALAAVPVFLAGCASLAPPPEPAPSPSILQARSYHNSIELGGRISVRYQGEHQEEALHGNFTWNQTPDRTTVTLLSPLGQTVAIIETSAQGASLIQGGQPARTASDVDELTSDTLGWPLPVAGLRYWLQGFAVDSSGRRVMASSVEPDVLTRDGWRIRYPAWEDGHPKRIDLARNTEQAGEVSIRIVIDSWQAR